MSRIEPFFPRAGGLRRVGDRRVTGGIVYVIGRGSRWKDAPAGCGPRKMLYNRFVRRSQPGAFGRIFGSSAESGRPERLMIDATHLGAHRAAASLAQRAASREQRPNLFRHSRTVSWLCRCCARQLVFQSRSDGGKRAYISTTSRITSGDELKQRNGPGGLARDLRLMPPAATLV